MDGAYVCRTSSRASRRPPDVIAAVAILDSRWRRRKWHQPGLGVLFSIPSEVEVENGGPSASGRHLGWPHLQEPEMRSSKMATGSGRAAIFHLHLNGDRKKYPILLSGLDFFNCSEIWQAPRQQRCRDACQISELNDHYNTQSRGFETSRDLSVRRLIA